MIRYHEYNWECPCPRCSSAREACENNRQSQGKKETMTPQREKLKLEAEEELGNILKTVSIVFAFLAILGTVLYFWSEDTNTIDEYREGWHDEENY